MKVHYPPEKEAKLLSKIRARLRNDNYNISQIMFMYGIVDKEWLEEKLDIIEEEE